MNDGFFDVEHSPDVVGNLRCPARARTSNTHAMAMAPGGRNQQQFNGPQLRLVALLGRNKLQDIQADETQYVT